ncbi:MAG: 16S rRNA (cytidine(1402)-2'-O)-methyltransferase [Bacteroidetes bacterium]|nr:16S rRNA (cytidine(1402)-2'-O)-methyltransferase [Bacteroidota bacterium]
MALLYIVPTPIGNLEDITLRAIRTLKEVDFILAEDTRKTGLLLRHYEIQTKMYSHHLHNEHKTVASIVSRIAGGENAAIVTDAGTPAISDPGFLLVREAVKEGIQIITLPGATAFVPALVNSGLPNDRFCFEGFLPQKKGRLTKLLSLKTEERTMVFYESPHRLIKALEEFQLHFGATRKASVSREISKIYEETQRGTIPEIIAFYKDKTIKGEIVIVVEGYKEEHGKE